MKKKVEQYIKSNNLFDYTLTVGVAVSGGIDSMVMLNVLCNLGYSVKVFHFEHGIRGKDSLKDADFVSSFCSEKNIPCIVEHADIPEFALRAGISTETAARIKRYEFFDMCDCDVMAVAHHADDQAETILQHIVRGSGIKGLVGMLPKNGRIVRPMLCVSRDMIRKYAGENNIQYREDESNADVSYTRNHIRLKVMPELKKINPGVNDAFMRLAESAAGCLSLIESQSLEIPVVVENGEVSVDYEILKNAPDVVSKYTLYRMFCMAGQEVDIESVHFAQILSLDRTGAEKLIKNGFYARNEYGKLIISNKPHTIKTKFSIPFADGVCFPGGRLDISDNLFNPDNRDKFSECFSCVPCDSVVRVREQGDVFHPFGGKRKKLGDYFTDIKVPVSERDRIPLLASGHEIIWVIGYAISADYAVKDKNNYISIKFTGEKDHG